MSQTPKDSSLPAGNATGGSEALEQTTSQNSLVLAAVDSLNPAEVYHPRTNESPSPVNSTTSDTSDKVLEDSSIGRENGTAGQMPTLKKRKSPIEEQDGSSTVSEDAKLVNIVADLSTSDESFSNSIVTEKDTVGQVPTSKKPKPFTIIDDQDESTISEDAKLAYIVADLSTSDESFSNSKLGDSSKLEVSNTEDSRLGDSSKYEVSNKEDSKSKYSSRTEDSKSEGSSRTEDSKSDGSSRTENSKSDGSTRTEDSKSDGSTRTEDSKSEGSSKSDDSNTEDYSTTTAKEQSSDGTEIYDPQKEISNQNRHFRKKKPSVSEEKESSDSDKETLSSRSTHKESVAPNKPNVHSETISPNEEFFPHISDDSSKSKDGSLKSREGSEEDTESCVSGEDNAKQELSSRKRKLSRSGGEATEDADSEETSSNDDSHKSIKRRKKLTKTHK